ncbi:hypothetical protein ElyMa_005201100 [Elysia marginata]|uniref:Uncharacterized protein n=1 Tax=Elysia marginata TaxID=1093978 RepID=A0AAV4JVF5_9GAST|nr:hypothetical protein ElyMa_005201100 [Elysia marginata]
MSPFHCGQGCNDDEIYSEGRNPRTGETLCACRLPKELRLEKECKKYIEEKEAAEAAAAAKAEKNRWSQ